MDAYTTVFIVTAIIILVVGLWILINYCPPKKDINSSGQTTEEHRPDGISANNHGHNESETNTRASVCDLSPPPSYEDIFGRQTSLPAYDSIHVPKVTVIQVTESSGSLVMAVWILPDTHCPTKNTQRLHVVLHLRHLNIIICPKSEGTRLAKQLVQANYQGKPTFRITVRLWRQSTGDWSGILLTKGHIIVWRHADPQKYSKATRLSYIEESWAQPMRAGVTFLYSNFVFQIELTVLPLKYIMHNVWDLLWLSS